MTRHGHHLYRDPRRHNNNALVPVTGQQPIKSIASRDQKLSRWPPPLLSRDTTVLRIGTTRNRNICAERRRWSANGAGARRDQALGLRDHALYNFACRRDVVDQGARLAGDEPSDIGVTSLPPGGVILSELFLFCLQ